MGSFPLFKSNGLIFCHPVRNRYLSISDSPFVPRIFTVGSIQLRVSCLFISLVKNCFFCWFLCSWFWFANRYVSDSCFQVNEMWCALDYQITCVTSSQNCWSVAFFVSFRSKYSVICFLPLSVVMSWYIFQTCKSCAILLLSAVPHY